MKALALAKPSAEGWKQIEAGLASKWEGTEALAAKALGAWATPAAISRLRDLLSASFERKQALGLRKAIIYSLLDLVTDRDAEWAINLFNSRGGLERHELLPLMRKLTPEKLKFPLADNPMR